VQKNHERAQQLSTKNRELQKLTKEKQERIQQLIARNHELQLNK